MSRGALRSLAISGGLLLGVLIFRSQIGGPLVVDSNTLSPSIATGEWVWVWKWHGPPEPGMPVWVRWPGTQMNGAYRVAAVGPSIIETDADGTVRIDGRTVVRREVEGRWLEAWGDREIPITPGGPVQPSTEVPAGQVFLLADARPVGGDGRVHGVVPVSAILGTIGFLKRL